MLIIQLIVLPLRLNSQHENDGQGQVYKAEHKQNEREWLPEIRMAERVDTPGMKIIPDVTILCDNLEMFGPKACLISDYWPMHKFHDNFYC